MRIFDKYRILCGATCNSTMRFNNSDRLIFYTIMLFFVVFIHISEGRQDRTLRLSESLQFPCPRDPKRVSNWKHDYVVIFIDELKISFTLNHITLLGNYSLFIQQASLQHEGIYQCLQDEIVVAEFMLRVEGCIRFLFLKLKKNLFKG